MTAQFSKEKQNQIEAVLRQTVKNATPDCWMEIKSKVQQMEQKTMLPEEIGDKQMQNTASVVEFKNKKTGKKQWVAWYRWCAAALIVLLCGLGGNYYFAPSQYLAIDINPSFELQYNRLDKIVSVSGLNQDAETVLQDLKLKGLPLADGVALLLEQNILKGYLSTEKENDILITVGAKGNAQKVLDDISKQAQHILSEEHLKGNIVGQKMMVNEKVLQEAHAQAISAGKMNIIKRILAEDESLTAADLASIRVSDLLIYAKQHQVSLDDLLDEYDDLLEDSLEQEQDDDKDGQEEEQDDWHKNNEDEKLDRDEDDEEDEDNDSLNEQKEKEPDLDDQEDDDRKNPALSGQNSGEEEKEIDLEEQEEEQDEEKQKEEEDDGEEADNDDKGNPGQQYLQNKDKGNDDIKNQEQRVEENSNDDDDDDDNGGDDN